MVTMQGTETLKSIWQTYHEKGGPQAKEAMVMHCMPLVHCVVSKLAAQLPPHLDREDLIEAGTFGMIDAIERYNPQADAKFETYAVLRIRGAIIDELRSRDFVPRSLRKKAREIQEARAALTAENDAAPTTTQLAEALDLDEQELESALAEIDKMSCVTSLYDQRSDNSESFRVVDMLVDPKSASPSNSIEVEEKKRSLASAIQNLPEQERLVVTLYYYEGMLLKEIGELLGVSESRISQIRSRALMLLKIKMKQKT